ncbi:MAG: trypsin-like peptidase domain-containing protein [Roseiflexaceae bacterium]|nr:trypsin-like peptidase domain-containing protein [Roseiflexaceae bacterium]
MIQTGSFTPVYLPADLSLTLAEIAQRAAASVVQVRVEGRGGGAGFVWRADGEILTNQHVVGAAQRAEVQLADGTTHTADVVARNQTLDLAVLRVNAHGLPTIPAADSARLRVGELVVAIGHPWGQKGVVTMGLVSGMGELVVSPAGRTAQYIRSDVRLAPGNSGGPLLNARGEVVGINAMIFGGDLSVAIPMHVAEAWADGAADRQPVTLGVQVQQVELRSEQKRFYGLLVAGIAEGSLAERGGLMVGDVLLELNGAATTDPVALRDALANIGGERLAVRMLRGGEMQALEIALSRTTAL